MKYFKLLTTYRSEVKKERIKLNAMHLLRLHPKENS